jgi:hypothetical protein
MKLLAWLCNELQAVGWGRADAVLLPAGFLHDEVVLGPFAYGPRKQAIFSTPTGCALRRASERLASVNGAVLVVGLDTRPYLRGFRGDQMMIAMEDGVIIGVARKTFASPIDTRKLGQRSYLAFEHDATEHGRVIALPSGDRAVLCPCYDAFIFGRMAGRPEARWQYIASRDEPTPRSPSAAGDLYGSLLHHVMAAKPKVALVGIHGFDQPGRDTRWQRHGIACASAALDGGAAIGAAHFRYQLPDPDRQDHSSLASVGVKRSHVTAGLHRKARKLAATDSFSLAVPGSPNLAATVRLFEF